MGKGFSSVRKGFSTWVRGSLVGKGFSSVGKRLYVGKGFSSVCKGFSTCVRDSLVWVKDSLRV